MKPFVLLIGLLLATIAFSAQTTAEKLAADKEVKTSSGAVFIAPVGWTLKTAGSVIILEPPEQDAHLVVVDTEAASADDAVKAAWNAYKPGETRPLQQKLSGPARDGWEEIQVYLYETSPNERLAIQATALRSQAGWTVSILDGKLPTVQKRSAAVGQVLASLRPSSYVRESFAGRKALRLDAERLAKMREFVEMGMRALDIPGVGLAFIDQGKIVYEGGLGVKGLGKPDPVDANTLFMAASNTKGMTTLLLAEL